jgi:hypothetical protein
MIMSHYPALKESISALLTQADAILVTPITPEAIMTLLKSRLREPKHHELRTLEPIATVLERHSSRTISEWLRRVNSNQHLTCM